MKVLSLVTLLVGNLGATDPRQEGPGLAIDLISESQSLVPGMPLTVGLHLHHFPGFHTYWKNPGQVGVATSIAWFLPEGFTASTIAWPFPENTFMGTYPCHGYDRHVTLLTTIYPPDSLTSKTVTISAKTMWMCCAKGCFPGFQTFDLTLPVSDAPAPDAAASTLIQKARKELPEANHDLKATLVSKMDSDEIKIRFVGEKKLSPEGAYFFSSDGQISSDQKQIFIPAEDGSLLLTIARSEFSPKGSPSLPGVIRMDGRHLIIQAEPTR